MAWRRREALRGASLPGEQVEDAIAAARALQAKGLLLTLDYLGESVATTDQATAATREYVRLMDDIVAADIERNISVKLTQLGLAIDRATCVDNMRRILEPARRHGFFVRIDMENSPYTDVTLEVFETLWNLEYRNIGVVLQSYLLRTERDLRRMNELGARVRLVKGAYREPAVSGLPAEGGRRCRLPPSNATAARSRHLSRVCDARCGAAERDQGVRGGARSSVATDTSSRCCTASGAICRRRLSPTDIGCGSTCPSGASGSRTSCAASANVLPTLMFVLRAMLREKN